MVKYIRDYRSNPSRPYVLLKAIHYTSPTYGKEVFVPVGRRSDGATGAWDIVSESWWVHDELCNTGKFKDGSLCTNLQASTILSDILKSEGYWFRARTWFMMTLAFGGGKARDNGIF